MTFRRWYRSGRLGLARELGLAATAPDIGESIGKYDLHDEAIWASGRPGPRLWLSPPERQFALPVESRQRMVRGPTILRLGQHYAPAGMRVLSSCCLLIIIGQSLAVLGLALLVLSAHSHGRFIAAMLMCGLGVPFLMLGRFESLSVRRLARSTEPVVRSSRVRY
jgi:hypothetical protein